MLCQNCSRYWLWQLSLNYSSIRATYIQLLYLQRTWSSGQLPGRGLSHSTPLSLQEPSGHARHFSPHLIPWCLSDGRHSFPHFHWGPVNQRVESGQIPSHCILCDRHSSPHSWNPFISSFVLHCFPHFTRSKGFVLFRVIPPFIIPSGWLQSPLHSSR